MTTSALFQRSYKADADFSLKYGYGIKLAAADDTCSIAGAGEQGMGVLQNTPVAGAHAQVGMLGIYPVVAGAAFLKDAKLTTAADGRFVTAVSGDYVYGTAQEAAAAANVKADALILHQGKLP